MNETPTEYLILEVLVARTRLGETCWTFPKRFRPAVRRLESRNLVWWKDGIVSGTIRVWLTPEGWEECASDTYVEPGAPHHD